MGEPIKSFIDILDPNFVNSDLIGEVGAEKVVTITKFEKAEYYDQKTMKKQMGSAVYFEECLPLILNATNTKTLKKLFSPNEDNTENCVGHKVILYVTTTKVAGNIRHCIRIKEYNEVQIKCDNCGEIIKPIQTKSVVELVEISKRNFNKALCNECMKKLAKENKNG